MPIERVFLDWDGPCLPRVVRWLAQRYQQGRTWDLAEVILVTPGQRAGRRLLELLVDQAQGVELTPPVIITQGDLPEHLYEPTVPIAAPWASILARMDTLRQAPEAVLRHIVARVPDRDDIPAWYALAREMDQLTTTLAGEAVHVDQIEHGCQVIDGFTDQPRWRALSELQHRYEQKLAGQHVQDPHTARFEALAKPSSPIPSAVVLVATADLNRVTRRLVERIPSSVTALIHAPASHEAGFDAVGSLEPEYWSTRQLSLDPSRVRVVDRSTQQADDVLAAIDQAGAGDLTADQVTVGLGDASIGPSLARQMALAGVPTRVAAGRPVASSRPALLLLTFGRYLQDQRFDRWADLLRHPDLERYLDNHLTASSLASDRPQAASAEPDHSYHPDPPGISDWLTLLDRYINDHLQQKVTDAWLGDPQYQRSLKSVHDAVASLWPIPADQARPLPQWSQPLAELLINIYHGIEGDVPHGDQADLVKALELIGRALRELAALDASHPFVPQTKASQAIELLLARLAGQAIPPESGQRAVELLGWLEMPLDDAPVAIITGFNEGMIPQSVTGDSFLPDTVSRAMKIRDNRHRYARDLMMLEAIMASRPRVTLVCSRRGQDGQPLAPSRLMFAGPDDQRAHLVERFFDPTQAPSTPRRSAADWLGADGRSRLTIPAPDSTRAAVTRLRVTAFRDYLACPYRFYLKHVMKLDVLDDDVSEMPAHTFGSLAHAVLRQFAVHAEISTTEDPERIWSYLSDCLDQQVYQRFGSDRSVAVRVQCQSLADRLRAFAAWQAQQIRDGWRILPQHAEVRVHASLDVDGQPFGLVGQIDRIDHHPQWGYRVIDYKTSEQPQHPDKHHRRTVDGQRRWVDLQLPLYQILARTIGISGRIDLGYVHLPQGLAKISFSSSGWTPEEVADAINQAKHVIRAILAGQFWAPGDPPAYDDGLHRVCMDQCVGRADAIARSGQSTG